MICSNEKTLAQDTFYCGLCYNSYVFGLSMEFFLYPRLRNEVRDFFKHKFFSWRSIAIIQNILGASLDFVSM